MPEDIRDIPNYDPTTISDEDLVYDWAIVIAWYSRVRQGLPLVHDKETVLNLAHLIHKEMLNRGMKHHPEKMGVAGKELLKLLEEGKVIDKASGLYIVPRHADLISEDKKSLLVKSRPFNIAGGDYVLVTKRKGAENAEALGAISLDEMEELTLGEFKKRRMEHLITEPERLSWWPDATTLYAWPISFEGFESPRPARWIPGTQVFMQSVQYLDQELAPVLPSGFQGTGRRVTLREVLPFFKSFYVKKPFITLVGGLCNHPSEGTEGDIDILINKTHVPEDDLALEFRLYRQFPKDLWDRLHFLYDNEHQGPFTNHIPLYNEFIERCNHSDIVLMSAMDQLRGASAKISKMAERSKKEDKVKPFRFFLQQKPVHGRREDEIYSPGALEHIILSMEDWKAAVGTGIYVELKLDGMRVQVHKVGEKIIIWSEDGKEVTDLIPELRDAFLDITQDFVCGCELELWLDGVHQNRADTSGVVHSKSLEQTKHLRAVVYDTQWFGGLDIHSLPFEERIPSIDAIKKGTRIQPSKRELVKGMTSILMAVREAASQHGSEGAMLKLPEHPYELDGKTFGMMKYKNEFKFNAEVTKRNNVKDTPGVYYYHCGVKRHDGSLAYCGKTFNTKKKASPGDRLEVVFVEVNMYEDPETGKQWFNWWSPRVVGKTTKPTTTAVYAKKIVLESSGQIGIKREPTTDAYLGGDTVSADGARNPEFREHIDEDIFLKMPPEGTKHRGIVHYHQRGRSVHLDWRIGLTKDQLIGFTLFIPKGTSRDATSLTDARRLYETEIKPIVEEKLRHKTKNFLSLKKAPEPIEWIDDGSTAHSMLTFEGCVPPPPSPTGDFEGEAKPGQIGATKYEHGWFVIIDSFDVDYGCFPAGEKVLTSHGPRPIEAVETGEYLLGDGNHWVKVTNTFSRLTDKLVELNVRGFGPLKLTPNHKVWSIKMEKKTPCLKDYTSNPLWIPAGNLEIGDFVAVPKIKKSCPQSIHLRNPRNRIETSIVINEDVAWLLGLFMGDGYASDINACFEVAFSNATGQGTARRFHSVAEALGLRVSRRESKGCFKLLVNSIEWSTYLRENFYINNRKTFPVEFLFLSKPLIRSFLTGYYDADGRRKASERGQLSLSTANPDNQRLVALAMGKLGIIPGGTSKRSKAYQVQWMKKFLNLLDDEPDGAKRKHTSYLEDKDFYFVRVTGTSHIKQNVKVYNLETEDNTIYTPLKTHNSQKPYFHEYHLNNAKLFRGRNVFRLLENREEWEEADEGMFSWMMNLAGPPPYVVSKRAVTRKWMPPLGHSALPADIKKQVPDEFQYWKAKTKEKALELRDELVEADILKFEDAEVVPHLLRGYARVEEGPYELSEALGHTHTVELDKQGNGVTTVNAGPDIDSHSHSVKSYVVQEAEEHIHVVLWPRMEDATDNFKLQYQTWRGPIVVRRGPSRQEYHLLLQKGDKVVDISSPTDPRTHAAATIGSGKARWELEEGDVKPQTKYNPTKDTPSEVEILLEGKVTWLIDTTELKKFHLTSDDFSNIYMMVRENKTRIWTIEPVEAAPPPSMEPSGTPDVGGGNAPSNHRRNEFRQEPTEAAPGLGGNDVSTDGVGSPRRFPKHDEG